ncbi:hypothetical protein NPIL_165081 [Nephila pilipes]|uniref:Uncharacterized protein n=1 Tax=Nephila pilipes TaxID=299642 RepID=A0A8X6PQM5_NEPPI|nr:hypothetical protein NPIL_165081 [Nephila pilipes]
MKYFPSPVLEAGFTEPCGWFACPTSFTQSVMRSSRSLLEVCPDSLSRETGTTSEVIVSCTYTRRNAMDLHAKLHGLLTLTNILSGNRPLLYLLFLMPFIFFTDYGKALDANIF